MNLPRVVRMTFAYVVENLSENITLEHLAEHCKTNKYTYIRSFRGISGMTPIKWIWELRVYTAAFLIKNYPQCALTDIAFACGFKSSSHFSRSFRQCFGCSPLAYRKASISNNVKHSADLILSSHEKTGELPVELLAALKEMREVSGF